MRKLLYLTAALLLAASTSAAAGEVRKLRVWAGPDSTRAVLDLDGQVDYKLFALENPARVVVDIDDIGAAGDLSFVSEHSGVIARVCEWKRVGVGLRDGLGHAEKMRMNRHVTATGGACVLSMGSK